MKRMTTYVMTLFFSVGLFAQQQKPQQTQFYQSLITVSEGVLYTNAQSFLASTFNLTANDKLVLVSALTDEVGYTHYKYEQKYKNLDVEGATVTLHVLQGEIKSISGNYRQLPELAVLPGIAENLALQNALSKVNANTYVWQQNPAQSKPAGTLLVFTHPVTLVSYLAYKFDVYAVEPLYRAYVFVDAATGDVIFEENRIHHTNVAASGNSLYHGNVSFTADFTGSNYRLRQTASGNGVETYNLNNGTNYTAATDFTSASSTSWPDATGVQAHWSAEKTHGYFLSAHNRNSFNGTGGIIKSYVHYSSNYVNAFWDGSRMTYGDGDGVNYGPLVSLDIVGHEITHGVTEYSANLTYSYESGALNESFSDIFGEAIENYATGSNNWQMGTDIGIGGSGAIRSMNNPNLFGDPDTYLGTYWYTGTGDNGGVHYNSGVQNKWFYILSAGESGTNDIGSSYAVTGIGIANAAKIAYRNLSVYLTASSTYSAARAGAIQSAIDLFGAGSAEVIATTNAWYAVGVGGAYGTISYCTSLGNNSSYEWIASVSVGSFTNNSGAAGYSNFTAQTVNVTAGQNYSVSLSPGFSGTTYQEYWKIWIDYNADGDFSDAGELAYSAGLSPATVNGLIAIPATASGTTRMRVSMKYNGAQTECEVFAYGEVEDYSISITSGGGGDTQAPTAPTNLTASGTTQTSTNLSWTASTDNVGVTGYSVYVDGILDGTTTNTSYAISNLVANTTYTVYVVATDAASNTSAQSNTVSVTTLPVGGGTTVLLGSYFETGWDGWADGGSDVARYKGTRSYEGIYSINIQDNSGAASTTTSPVLDLSGKTQVLLEFYFYAVSMETGEDFWLQYYNGSTWTTVATYVRGTGFNNSTFYSASVTLNSTGYTFSSTSRFRFVCDASANDDKIYLDAIKVTATNPVQFNAPTAPVVTLKEIAGSAESVVEDEFILYPNPASGMLYLNAASAPEQVYIMNLTGQILAVYNQENGLESFDVSALASGTYVLAIRNGDETVFRKFIKQ